MSFIYLILLLLIYGIIALLFGKIIKKLSPWVYACFAVLFCFISLYFAIPVEDGETGIIFAVSSGVLFLFSLISDSLRKIDADNLRYEIMKKEKENWQKVEENRQNNAEKRYKTELDALVQQFGEPTKTFNFGNMTTENSIFIFESSKIAWMFGKAYSFDKIVNCSIAKKNVALNLGSKNVYCLYYTVILNVDDSSAPVINIDCDMDRDMAGEIYVTFSVIIKRKSMYLIPPSYSNFR